MELKAGLCKFLNCFFQLPVHPFNLQNQGVMSYAQWQYDKGEATIRYFLPMAGSDEMFMGKTVLDIGCGAAGKTIYYASKGTRRIYGMDAIKKYENEAYKLALAKGFSDRFEFVEGNAMNMPFEENFFDTMVMNDALEHLRDPASVLDECHRALKPGGRLYISFPPYYHPYGAHLSDLIGIPWVHLLFDDRTLIKVYKDLAKLMPDLDDRLSLRISADENGREYFSYINKMTIGKFRKLLTVCRFSICYYNEVPLRAFLTPLAHIPVMKECFVKMVVCILQKN